jgi:chromosome segregation ATPase
MNTFLLGYPFSASGESWTIPGAIFAGLMVLSILAGAVAVVRSSYAKARIEALQGDRDDLIERLNETRVEYGECKFKYEQLKVQLDGESHARKALEEVVTGKKELEAVLGILTKHDERTVRIETMVKQLLRTDSKRG